MKKNASYTNEWPIIHKERCHARAVRFTEEYAMIHLADGRVMGVPLNWFPPLHRATDNQRKNYIGYSSSVYWHDVDDGIDMTAMLTGMYIVPVYKREFRPQPHVPRTCVYLDGGARRTSGGMEGVPFVHDTRNIPRALSFTDEHLIVDLADGRILCLPWRFSLKLAQASDKQRQNYQRTGLELRWEELGEGIDLIAMLTGFYDPEEPHPQNAVEPAETATT
ncbi:MAG: DUF2442 domain-containing protein [Chloroflexi bacterium]|nr:DUF2442 domain-containing protein [Chloroflexota bacterium]